MTRKEITAALKGLKSGDYDVTIDVYQKNTKGEYHWLFGWEGGGWNDVWAKTKAAAIRKANKGGLRVDASSIRKATQKSANAWYRMGDMMCN